ncbi:MAG: hypothetical protein FWG73_06910 [Planctomycetaceae bacterium]|nr:hypothetical protein [Planctomycetaceae bacterium]
MLFVPFAFTALCLRSFYYSKGHGMTIKFRNLLPLKTENSQALTNELDGLKEFVSTVLNEIESIEKKMNHIATEAVEKHIEEEQIALAPLREKLL